MHLKNMFSYFLLPTFAILSEDLHAVCIRGWKRPAPAGLYEEEEIING